MGQQVRNHMVEFLCSKTTMVAEKVLKMTDAEIEYYHWLYSDDDNSGDYVRVH
ncbi:BH0509 family protein [Bacillus taeanensis]|uniref:BH0509 family protein n=1 Tax=Bacillus taeanensis TaxID=273032 RepID=A0A366XXG9_9BACI|nr:BH0509 family protein [Bacillus taeanensis]RBW68833.1 hypothetical protein DS031_14950 [Bacillus taeanensis]